MSTPPELVMLLLETVAILTAATFGLSVIREHIRSDPQRDIAMGVVLGCAAFVSMLYPMPLGNGVTIDIRGIMVGVAGAFFGPIGGVVACALAMAGRVYLGGLGLWSSLIGIALAAGLGYGWRLTPERAQQGPLGLLLLGVMISGHLASPLPFLPPGWVMQFYTQVGVPLAFTNILGALVFGLLIRREFALQAMASSLERAANTDPLTGLSNRRHLQQMYDRLAREDRPMTLVYMDLDHFKQVNDYYGHSTGDDVLVHVAQTLTRMTPPGAVAARLGGEEFALLLPDLALDPAIELAQDLCHQIGANPFRHPKAVLRITISAGLSHIIGPDAFEELLSESDACLYAAKARGRNQLIVPEHLRAGDRMRPPQARRGG